VQEVHERRDSTYYAREFELCFALTKQKYDRLRSGALTTCCVKIRVMSSRNVYLALENRKRWNWSESQCWNYESQAVMFSGGLDGSYVHIDDQPMVKKKLF